MGLFQKIGINLDGIDKFVERKDFINSIVVKRNKIIHQNDDASDVSIKDLVTYVEEIKQYMECVTDLTFPVKFGWPTATPQLSHVI